MTTLAVFNYNRGGAKSRTFDFIDKGIIINESQGFIPLRFFVNMHNSNLREEAPTTSSNQSHPYDCGCNGCQIKFGSLPLLVQVIEGQENTRTIPTSSPCQEKPSTSSASDKNAMSCPHCSKKFTHRGDFNKHIRKHTGEQPFTCPVCRRKFAHTSNLNRHLKVHSGDRPFVCDVCHKKFNRKDKLNLHKKTKLCRKFQEN